MKSELNSLVMFKETFKLSETDPLYEKLSRWKSLQGLGQKSQAATTIQAAIRRRNDARESSQRRQAATTIQAAIRRRNDARESSQRQRTALEYPKKKKSFLQSMFSFFKPKKF